MSRAAPNKAAGAGTTTDSVVPTLRVMRLQSPELHKPFAPGLEPSNNSLQNALCLPDSIAVFVGEKFTAYLGIINSNKYLPIRKLSVNAMLQTPTNRWQLHSPLDAGSSVGGGMDVAPNAGVDAIVSHDIEEPGQHILRVEVSYISAEGNSKTFRKFYRFQVVTPILVSCKVLRAGDATCFVSVLVEWNSETEQQQPSSPSGSSNNADKKPQLMMSEVEIQPQSGLTVTRVDDTAAADNKQTLTAVDLLEQLHLLTPGGSYQYLFKLQATSKEAILRGVAAGDTLGKAVVTWCKAMGETGRVLSPPIVCPVVNPEIPTRPNSNFVVYNSGLSVDVAAAVSLNNKNLIISDVAQRLPVTVEPIDPPTRMQLHVPREVQFLVVNHGTVPMNLQLQFRLSQMNGIAICGSSYQSLGEVSPNGGSTVASARFMPLAAGMLKVQGCYVQDLATEQEIAQPALFQTFVNDGQVEQ